MTDKLDWYRIENGQVMGGPYNCAQTFPVEQLPWDDPRVVDFYVRTQAAMQTVALRPTIEDVVAILTPQQKGQLETILQAKRKP